MTHSTTGPANVPTGDDPGRSPDAPKGVPAKPQVAPAAPVRPATVVGSASQVDPGARAAAVPPYGVPGQRPEDVKATPPVPGTSPDRSGSSQDRSGSSQERSGSSQDRTGSSQERTGSSQERTGSSQERTGASQDRTGTSQDRFGSSQERSGSSQDRFGSSQERTGTSQERVGTSPECDVNVPASGTGRDPKTASPRTGTPAAVPPRTAPSTSSSGTTGVRPGSSTDPVSGSFPSDESRTNPVRNVESGVPRRESETPFPAPGVAPERAPEAPASKPGRSPNRPLLGLVALAAFAVGAAGCNTSEGFGKDLESGGRAIKETAQDAND